MTVVIIDYGSGNLRSAAKAFEWAIAEAGLDQEVRVTSRPKDVAAAAHIVLPGVGAFGDCLAGLKAVAGMIDALTEAVIHRRRPFLGVCVGMQLMAEWGREHGDHAGLGWIPGQVAPLAAAEDKRLKIPHMGWNDLDFSAQHPVLAGIRPGAHAYFVHSFNFRCADPGDQLATVDYGGPVTAVIGRGNMIGTQFHPEKSQATGLKLIGNFLRWRP